MAKVLVVGAHDDDPVIGVGGILQKMHAEDEVWLVICTDGRASHSHVLGIYENPTPREVASRRADELFDSCDVLKRKVPNLNYDHWTFENGSLENSISALTENIRSFLSDFLPDVVYVHALDAHPEHRAAHYATLRVLREISFDGEVNLYSIWTRELAAGRMEVDASQIQELTGESVRVDVRSYLETKRAALHAFTSQVQLWPYVEWQPQEKPILEKAFLDYFLRGEEIITPVCL